MPSGRRRDPATEPYSPSAAREEAERRVAEERATEAAFAWLDPFGGAARSFPPCTGWHGCTSCVPW